MHNLLWLVILVMVVVNKPSSVALYTPTSRTAVPYAIVYIAVVIITSSVQNSTILLIAVYWGVLLARIKYSITIS